MVQRLKYIGMCQPAVLLVRLWNLGCMRLSEAFLAIPSSSRASYLLRILLGEDFIEMKMSLPPLLFVSTFIDSLFRSEHLLLSHDPVLPKILSIYLPFITLL